MKTFKTTAAVLLSALLLVGCDPDDSDPFTTDDAPIPLQSNGTTVVYRVPSIGNNGLIANVGDEAKVAVGSRDTDIRSIRLYVFVADYMAEQLLRHFLTGIVLATPSCDECKAELVVNSLSLQYAQ